MKAVVLSGGGSKGSYQIGVWKALRKLHIKYDIVTGTSVGALNGALMVQNNYFKALRLWKHINLELLFGKEAITSTNNKEVFKMYKDNFLKQGGMEVEKLEGVIGKYVNSKKFFASNINYGLVTINITKKKALELKKKDMKEDKLVDYLMASASCYPAFKKKNIDGENYIDGGMFDNMPINLAISLGANEVIAVDLSAPGFNRKPKKKVPTTVIKPNNELSFFLNFEEISAKRNIKFGYNDTMKAFGKLEGKKYTFKKNHPNKNYLKYKDTYKHYFDKVINSDKLLNTFLEYPILKSIKTDKSINKFTVTIMESVAKLFYLDETKIYSYKKFNKLLLKSLKNDLKIYTRNKYKDIFKSKETTLDIYKKLNKHMYKELRKNIILTPHEFLMALYLYSLEEN